jgi:hypothetical protein
LGGFSILTGIGGFGGGEETSLLVSTTDKVLVDLGQVVRDRAGLVKDHTAVVVDPLLLVILVDEGLGLLLNDTANAIIVWGDRGCVLVVMSMAI